MNFFLATIISFIIGLVSAAIISKVGFKLGLADIPNKRSAHHIPIPKGGGIGIPIAAVIVSLFINKVYILIGLAFILSVIALINDPANAPAAAPPANAAPSIVRERDMKLSSASAFSFSSS